MRILLTGVTGYIGKRLLPVLLEDGHEVICCVRDKKRFPFNSDDQHAIKIIEVDFLKQESLYKIPTDIDVAFYLIHSMSSSVDQFNKMESTCAHNFKERLDQAHVKQVIYLSGISNESKLSTHLQSRKTVESILNNGSYHLTTLRAGIIVGSGSASFEIIRDLTEKLPVMITPKWLNTRCQPIAIRNVIQYLKRVILDEFTFDKTFDIGGHDILTYKEMLLKFAETRGLKRFIFTLPVMTPKLSSYWLYFVTSTSYKLAVNLVDSMKIEVVCKNMELQDRYQLELLSYTEAVSLAFDKIEQQEVLSSWTDALSRRKFEVGVDSLLQVPSFGCLKDEQSRPISNRKKTLDKIWSIGGLNGWYYGNWLWEIRGFLDKLVGGVGLRRGRKNQTTIEAGESLDFWRVLYASREEGRLLLYAEMRVPGEAWLEFNLKDQEIFQTATFRPRGLWGRLYWYAMMPMHYFIFNGMLAKIAQ